jgi:hypothetical protein
MNTGGLVIDYLHLLLPKDQAAEWTMPAAVLRR